MIRFCNHGLVFRVTPAQLSTLNNQYIFLQEQTSLQPNSKLEMKVLSKLNVLGNNKG